MDRKEDDQKMYRLHQLLGRLQCWLGLHDFRIIDKSFEFTSGCGIEKVECRRCGLRFVKET